MKEEMINVRIDHKLKNDIRKIAKQQSSKYTKVSLTNVVERALEWYITEYEKRTKQKGV